MVSVSKHSGHHRFQAGAGKIMGKKYSRRGKEKCGTSLANSGLYKASRPLFTSNVVFTLVFVVVTLVQSEVLYLTNSQSRFYVFSCFRLSNAGFQRDDHALVPLSELAPDLCPLVPTPFSNSRAPPLPQIFTFSLVAISTSCCFLCHQLNLPLFPE